MNYIKIKNVEPHVDSKGAHVVCRGILTLVKSSREDAQVSRSDYPFYLLFEDRWVIPVIISEEEMIEANDLCLDLDTHIIFKFSGNYETSRAKKILALPENLSSNHIKAIASGKIKDGDGILVECEVKQYSQYKGVWCVKFIDNNVRLAPSKIQAGWDEFLSTLSK